MSGWRTCLLALISVHQRFFRKCRTYVNPGLIFAPILSLAEGRLIAERPDAEPNSTVEVSESLPDGTEFKAVWSYLPQSDVAKLVTVHFFD
jgi:hypothetical protein